MITQSEYAKRRKILMEQIGEKGALVLPAAPERQRNGDAVYAYRQNSDFFYLTGFQEPDAVLLLLPKRSEGEFILFNRVRDRSREIWDGPRAGQEGARDIFQADAAYPIEELEQRLPQLLAGREALHYTLGTHLEFDPLLLRALNQLRANIRSGQQSPLAFFDITASLHEMRIIKSEAEVNLMRKACEISAKAHVRAMQACRPGLFEYELEAELLYEFTKQGARAPAYNSIVGSGKNSCILHYVINDKQIEPDDLVLIDAGAEYHGYAADITRTFPASGKFTAEQRAIYELVLASQLAALAAIKPGVLWTKPQEIIVEILTQGLVDLGLLKGDIKQLIDSKAYFSFYMHKSGHYLGLDVHDAGRYLKAEKWREFTPGMTLTVEPGLYLSADIPGLDQRWHNIGVRIEDDVLVTEKGIEILTAGVPKSIAEIEALMAKS